MNHANNILNGCFTIIFLSHPYFELRKLMKDWFVYILVGIIIGAIIYSILHAITKNGLLSGVFTILALVIIYKKWETREDGGEVKNAKNIRIRNLTGSFQEYQISNNKKRTWKEYSIKAYKTREHPSRSPNSILRITIGRSGGATFINDYELQAEHTFELIESKGIVRLKNVGKVTHHP